MRLKRGSVIISSIVTAILVISTIFLFFASEVPQPSKVLELLYNLCLSAFGSGCVVLILSVYEYKQARVASIRNFCDEAYSIITRIEDLDYLYIDSPPEVILEALRERATNQIMRQLADDGELIFHGGSSLLYRDTLANNLCEKEKRLHPDIQCVNEKEFYQERADNELNYYIQAATDIMNQYLSLSSIDTLFLRRLYKDIAFLKDYLIRTEKQRLEYSLYIQIVIPIEEKIKEIRKACDTCFRIFAHHEHDNYNILLQEVLKLQDGIFHLTWTLQQNINIPRLENKFADDVTSRISYWEQRIASK